MLSWLVVFVLVESGAVPLWAGKAPTSCAPPTSTLKIGGGTMSGRGQVAILVQHFCQLTHIPVLMSCGNITSIDTSTVVGKCCGGSLESHD